MDLTASNWISGGQVTIEDYDLDGDLIFDSVKITLGDDQIGPEDRVPVTDNGYYLFAALELPWGTTVMVDVESYDVKTFAATDEVSTFSIGLTDHDHVQLPENTMWQPSYQGLQPRTSMGEQRMYGLATTEAYVLHVGVEARGIAAPTDDGASYGEFIIRSIDARSEDQPHDPHCEEDARGGRGDHGGQASLRNGESSFTISLNAAGALHYNSFDNPHPMLATDYILPDPAPDRIEVTVDYEVDYPGFETPTVYYDTGGLHANERVTVALRPSVPFEGAFDYHLLVRPYYDDVPGPVEAVPGRHAVQDRRFSEFGNRFSWVGLDYLVPQYTLSGDLNGVQLSTSDSNAIWFIRDAEGAFSPPVGVFLQLEQRSDQTFALRDHLGNRSLFDHEGSLVKRIDANGNETVYEYLPDSYLLSRIIDPFGRVTHLEYQEGMLDGVTDFAGRKTYLSYVDRQLVQIIEPDPDGAGPQAAPVTELRYDAEGQVIEVEDPRGHVTVSHFDARGLLIGGTYRDGATWGVQSTYSSVLIDPATGQGTATSPAPAVPTEQLKSQSINARGYLSETLTDHFGLSQAQQDPLDHRFAWTRDPLGRVLQQTEPDPDGDAGPLTELITNYQYADCGTVSQITFADQSQVHYSYNALSRPTMATDELHRMTRWEYDGTDLDGDGIADGPNPIVQTQVMGDRDFILPRHPDDPDDLVTTYRYSDGSDGLPRGLLLSETDPMGRRTEHIYQTDRSAHDFGWVIQTVYAVGTLDEGAVSFEYDRAGNIAAVVNELGHRTEYTFDDLDRLILIAHPDPDPTNGDSEDISLEYFAYDANDNLVLAIDGEGRRTEYRYDEENRLIEVNEELTGGWGGVADHRITSYTYDGNGNLSSEVDPLGRVTRFHYDPLDRLIAIVGEDVDQLDVLPRTNAVNPYDVNGDGQVDPRDLTLIVDAWDDPDPFEFDPRRVSPTYVDVNGDLVIDADDQQEVVTFIEAADQNEDGQVDADEVFLADVHPRDHGSGRPTHSYRYDAVGNRTAVRDANGNETTYRYDARNRLIESTLPSITNEFGELVHAPRRLQTYDDAGQRIAETDALGRVTQYEYDDAGRLVTIRLPDAGAGRPTTMLRYDAAGNLRTRIDPLGNETHFTYDARDRLVGVRHPDPDPSNATLADVPEEVYELDRAGRLIRTRAPEGRVTEYRYDDLSRLIERRLPDPDPQLANDEPVERYEYDRVGNVVGRIDGEGNLTRYLYDALDRLTAIIEERPDGAPGGLALGIDATTDLDALRAEHPVTEYQYDAAHNLIQEIDPLSRQTRYAYDALNRLQTIAFADPVSGIAADPTQLIAGHATTPMMAYGYDLVGNRVSEQDARHPPTTSVFDAWHRLVTKVDPLGHTESHRYDLEGNLRFSVDAVLNTTEWQYDALNRIVAEVNPLGDRRSYRYDQADNLVQRTDRNDRVIVWQHDQLDRIAQERWYTDAAHLAQEPQAPLRVIQSRYDTAGRLTELGDADAIYEYAYDTLDRTVTHTQRIGSLAPIVAFRQAFDRNHQRLETRATFDFATDSVTSYAFDNLVRLRQVEQRVSGTTALRTVDLRYDLAGQRFELIRDGGEAVPTSLSRYEFDRRGRLTDLGHSREDGSFIASYHLEYLPDDRLTSITSAADQRADAEGRVSFTHDHRGQVTRMEYDFAHYRQSHELIYDGNGNRASVTDRDADGTPLRTFHYATTAGNRVQDDGQFTYRYDREGNRLSRTELATGATTAYEWDHRNRLVGVTTESPEADFSSHGEVGWVSVDQQAAESWTTVMLQGTYRDPVVITSPATRNDATPTTVRVRNVTADSFEVQVDEWDYLDGVHAEEQIGYLVMEAGRYELPDGTQLEAGKLSADHTWTDHLFRTNFAAPPTVISSVMSARDDAAITTRISDLSASGFRIKVKEQETFARDPELRAHQAEQLAYVAVSGHGSLGVPFEVGTLVTGVVADERTAIPVSFTRSGLVDPIVFAALQTHAGGNALALRQAAAGPGGVDLFIEEEMSADTETRHVSESLGYLAFATTTTFTLPATPPGGEVGTVTASAGEWVAVDLQRSYQDPVVVTGPISRAGTDPLTARVRNVTHSGFEVQVAGWEYQTNVPATATVGYLVVEAGRHELADGATLEAGHTTVDHRWTSHQFAMDGFDGQPPVVLASVVTTREPTPVAVRLDCVTDRGFEVRLQEEEAARRDPLRQSHTNERVSFVAISMESGLGQMGSLRFESATRPTGVVPSADTAIPINFESPLHTAEPILFANLQTRNGGNTAALRFDQLNGTSVELFVEEEQSFDVETRHRDESLGYVVFAGSGTFELAGGSSPVQRRVEHLYDAQNQWIGRLVDEDGNLQTTSDQTRTTWVYHEGQIAYEFVDTSTADPAEVTELRHRYLWGDQVDELWAQESITAPGTEGNLLWTFGDHLGTIRDVVDAAGTVINHRTYTAFGAQVHETNPDDGVAFGFTGRYYDEASGLQNNLHRWYDANVGKWTSDDPIGFAAGDANLSRYVGNRVTELVDPDGLEASHWRRRLNHALRHARLSRAAYTASNVHVGDLVGNFEVKQISADARSGYRSVLFENQQNGRAVLAFAGTESASVSTMAKDLVTSSVASAKYALAGTPPESLPGNLFNHWADWLADLHQGAGGRTAQYEYAIKQTAALKQRYGDRLTLTGHSLGGGLASAASIVNELRAVTFDPAGVNAATIRRHGGELRLATSLIDAYRLWADPLTNLQDRFSFAPNTVGNIIELPATSNGLTYMLKNHTLDRLILMLEMLLGVQQCNR